MQRTGRRRTKGLRVASVVLSLTERELLERLAVKEGISLSDVWRRALVSYAEEREVRVGDDPRGEPMP